MGQTRALVLCRHDTTEGPLEITDKVLPTAPLARAITPCQGNGKSTEDDGNNTYSCSDKGVVRACCRATQAVTVASRMHESSGDSPISTSNGQEGVKVGGRTAINIPKITFLSPHHRQNTIFMDPQKTEPSNNMIPKVAATTPTLASGDE